MSYNLAAPLARYAAEHTNHNALCVGTKSLTYGVLAERARALAGHLSADARTKRVGILASRSIAACIGILGAAWAGFAYVPLNLKLPEERLIQILRSLQLDALVVDGRGARMLTPELLAAADCRLFAADDARSDLLSGAGRLSDIPMLGLEEPVPVLPDDIAYVEFTSGTTGQPKGVMVPVGAVQNYLSVSQDWFRLMPDDRAAETCDITFDLSVHNMFLTWQAGATLHVMTPLDMAVPARFIRDRQITTWLSVPSIIALMRKANTLGRGSLPSLRLSCFCGEPLPLGAARAWAEAASNSVIENIYGPTEATVACLRQPVQIGREIVTASRSIIAIGVPYPGMKARIVNEAGAEVSRGTTGEIALGGAQLALGYYGQEELTGRRFPMIDGERWYLTGDLGVEDEDGVFHHLGRIDNQVKVMGNRVELEEIEMHLRDAAGSDHVAAIAWPVNDGSAEGIVAFVTGPAHGREAIRDRLRAKIAHYMVPSAIHELEDLPLNSNGKVDRRQLAALLEQGLPTSLAEVAA